MTKKFFVNNADFLTLRNSYDALASQYTLRGVVFTIDEVSGAVTAKITAAVDPKDGSGEYAEQAVQVKPPCPYPPEC